MGLTKGESAPALCDSKGNPAVTHHGKPITLAEYAGKRVVIWFFPRASTEGCAI
jgi:peroxiredoxin